jgi:hypothetical protein
MIIVNLTESTKNLTIGSKIFTIEGRKSGPNTLLTDRDIISLVNNYTSEEIQFQVTAGTPELNQLADLGVHPDYIKKD